MSKGKSNKYLFIHLGLPKTGTSYIQSVFALNQDNYYKNGLIYPDLSGDNDSAKTGKTTCGNSHILFLNLNSPTGISDEFPFDTKHFFSNLDSEYHYLLSSEWLITLDIEVYKNIRDYVSPNHEIVPICWVRNPYDFALSSCFQGLKTGDIQALTAENMELFLENYSTLIQNLLKLLENFPATKVFNYDLQKYDLLSVMDNLFFGESVSIKGDLKIVNVSPTAEQAKILEIVNYLGIPQLAAVNQWLRDSVSRDADRVSNSNGNIFEKNTKTLKFYFNSNQLVTIQNLVGKLNKSIPESAALALSEKRYIECPSTDYANIKSTDLDLLKILINHALKENTFSCVDFLRKYHGDNKKIAGIPEDFDPLLYLLYNPDVLYQKMDPYDHYTKHGIEESRSFGK